ncbi:MAG TPA: type II toxin-antitoxin system prevent-host-death family antitoxin [Solirubrobacterales bacterium]
MTGSQEVGGSSPPGSTSSADGDAAIIVGAHLFRNHFGYWMERASAGDEILITRRGRRYARLGPPDPQLTPGDNDR